MRIGERAIGNQRAGAKQVVRCRDVVPGLVPVVRKTQQRQVREVQRDKDQRKDQPQGIVLVLPFTVLCSLS
jgi:hypothetical protein